MTGRNMKGILDIPAGDPLGKELVVWINIGRKRRTCRVSTPEVLDTQLPMSLCVRSRTRLVVVHQVSKLHTEYCAYNHTAPEVCTESILVISGAPVCRSLGMTLDSDYDSTMSRRRGGA